LDNLEIKTPEALYEWMAQKSDINILIIVLTLSEQVGLSFLESLAKGRCLFRTYPWGKPQLDR